MVTEVSDEAYELVSEVSSLVGFSLGGPVSEVVSTEGVLRGASRDPRDCPGGG